MRGLGGTETWDWEQVRKYLQGSFERNATDTRNVVEVVSTERLEDPWVVIISFVDRRDASQHQAAFDLARCRTAYNATTVEQLAVMVYTDLEESVLSAPAK